MTHAAQKSWGLGKYFFGLTPATVPAFPSVSADVEPSAGTECSRDMAAFIMAHLRR
jgi:hypothetical protein